MCNSDANRGENFNGGGDDDGGVVVGGLALQMEA